VGFLHLARPAPTDARRRLKRCGARTSFGLALAALLTAYGYAGAQVRARATAPRVVVEPAVFVGMVEVTGDHEHGLGVLLSTATEEVLIANDAVGERLIGLDGEVVAVEGRLIEAAEGPPTMIVRAFRVLGERRSSRGAVTWRGAPHAARAPFDRELSSMRSPGRVPLRRPAAPILLHRSA
jgi:hypothetical protein